MMRMVLVLLAAALNVGSPAPAFRVNDLAGKKFTSNQLKGRLTVLDVWATWCEPCIEDIPMFNRLYAKYGGAGIKVIGIAVQSGSAADIKKHVAKLGVQYPVLVGNDRIVGEYVDVGFPITYLISPDGKIAKKYIGVLPDKQTRKEMDLEREIERFIKDQR